MTRSERITVLLLGVMVLTVPLAARWWRIDETPGCAWDGLPIEKLYRVRIADAGGAFEEFCCVQCAAAWLARHEPPRAIFVTDEASGNEIRAETAVFVQSTVTTNPITRNSIHVFRELTDALEHADAFGGRVLMDEERPF